MSIKFNNKCPVWSKNFLIFIWGISGLVMPFAYDDVKVQDSANKPAAVVKTAAASDARELIYCGTMVSRVNYLEIKTDPNICSKEIVSKEKQSVRRIKVILTAYSSTVAQTDDTPFITANGTYVRDGIVANNGLPFGTELRIPELYGNKVFSVQDRMHQRMGNYKFDIWFPTYEQAKNFGVKYAYVEVLGK